MNNIRKSIITILSDYMDKTLSEWCLVDIDWDNKNIQKVLGLDWESAIINIYWSRWLLREWKSRIIGYYDITAVLKYINNSDDWLIKSYIDNFEISFDIIDKWLYFKIPNKPLHLYTEQEEKYLLDLLLNLK